MLVTNRDLMFLPAGNGRVRVVVPAGTPVIPATHYPEPDHYWAGTWKGIKRGEVGYLEDPGFLLKKHEVLEVEDPLPEHIVRRRRTR